MTTVIKVDNLSKQYRIGCAGAGYKTFRETLVDAAKAPFSGIAKLLNRQSSIVNRQSEDTIWALKDVSFEVKCGEVVGIIGRNGAGKSTLLKILSKITDPTEGRVELKGRVGSLLEVGTGFHPELTGHENVYLYGAILGMDRWEVTRKFDEIVAFAELEKFIDTPVKRYSSGMYMRLAFAVAAHMETEILLVDEVLAVGDAAFQTKCLGKMGEVSTEGRTVLFVSHNMGAVQNLCNIAMFLDGGSIQHLGNTNQAIDLYLKEVVSASRKRGTSSHIIFQAENKDYEKEAKFKILLIETLDDEGNPKEIVSTWDTVRFKIRFWAPFTVKTGAAVFRISTSYGMHLLLSSTQPDFTVPLIIQKGENEVECEIPSLPLSAGEYLIGAGLAIPNKEMLCWEDQVGQLTIHPKDVYGSGSAPTISRSVLALPHKWKVF